MTTSSILPETFVVIGKANIRSNFQEPPDFACRLFVFGGTGKIWAESEVVSHSRACGGNLNRMGDGPFADPSVDLFPFAAAPGLSQPRQIPRMRVA